MEMKPLCRIWAVGLVSQKIANLTTDGRWRAWTVDLSLEWHVTAGRRGVASWGGRGVVEGGGGQAETTGAMAEGPPPLHPVLQPLSFLLGTWRGEGEGGFPTIQSFKYGEEIRLWHSGKPVIAYSQKTWKAASGEPMHAESGYWRPKPDGSIEAVIAQSTGLAEVQKGSFDAEKKTVQLQSSLVGNASKVLDIGRVFEVEGEELRYTVEMAIHGHEQQPHLRAVLRKVTDN